MTDHGSVSGLVQLNEACKKQGLKPIFGCEFYMVDSLEKMYEEKIRSKHHITILAENYEGYKNLLTLSSLAYQKGFYYRPTIDLNLLFEYNKGLIVLSGCWNGMFQRLLQSESIQEAKALAGSFKDVFGDRYYLETQHYPLFRDTIQYLEYVSHTLEIPIVLTCDPHYLTAEQAPIQEVLHAIRDRREFNPQEIIYGAYQWPADSLFEAVSLAFPNLDVDTIFNNVCDIGARCNVEMPVGGVPRFVPIGGDTGREAKYELLELCKAGIKKRGLENAGEKYRERFRTEYNLIVDKDFADYFLIVSDMVQWAKNNNIAVGPARGSSAGSLICYLLGITEVNPFDYDLIFERFIDESRVDLPDIDVDFEDEKRDDIKRYMSERYGADKVCNLASFTSFRGKNTLADVGKIFSVPYAEVETVKNNVIQRFDGDEGLYDTIKDTFEDVPRAKEILEKNPDLSFAADLEGQIRNMTTHAAGLIVGDRPLNEIIALYQRDGQTLSSVEMKDSTKVGLLKIDVLGLTELTILRSICDMINWSIDDLYAVPVDDPITIKGFRDMDLSGIFQFEGDATKNVLRQMTTINFEELVACNALSRPGPVNSGCTNNYLSYMRGKGKKTCLSTIPKAAEITEKTYYQIIYQEQALSLIREIGGMSWAESNKIRSLMGKSQGEQIFDKYWEDFRKGAIANGISENDADFIWNSIKTMGKYAYNKSHAVSYTLLSFWCMYMKKHYPLQFYAARLMKEKDDDTKRRLLLEISNNSIPIYPPVIGKSVESWKIEGNGLRAGLTEVDGIGEKTAAVLVQEGYTTREDFETKKNRSVTKKTIRVLEDCQAFDNGTTDFFKLNSYAILDTIASDRSEIGNILESTGSYKVKVAGYVRKVNYKDYIEESRNKGRDVDDIKFPQLSRYAVVTLEDNTDACPVYIDRFLFDKISEKVAFAFSNKESHWVVINGNKVNNSRLVIAKDFVVYKEDGKKKIWR